MPIGNIPDLLPSCAKTVESLQLFLLHSAQKYAMPSGRCIYEKQGKMNYASCESFGYRQRTIRSGLLSLVPVARQVSEQGGPLSPADNRATAFLSAALTGYHIHLLSFKKDDKGAVCRINRMSAPYKRTAARQVYHG